MRKYLFLLLFAICHFAFGQNNKLKGLVISSNTKKPLNQAHVLNLNTVVGTITSKEGLFEISSKVNDTILVSFLGYESIKLKVTNDLLKGHEIEIALNEKPEEVKEIVIKSTKLIGILEVDVKQVPKDRFTRIHLNGVPQTYETNRPQKNYSVLENIFNPVDLMYNLFGKKPRELKKLQKLKKEEDLRKMFSNKYDREVMMEYLNMDRKEFNRLVSKCNYSEYFIQKASDLQLIEAVLDCYENYKAVKKGAINRNRFPEQEHDVKNH